MHVQFVMLTNVHLGILYTCDDAICDAHVMQFVMFTNVHLGILHYAGSSPTRLTILACKRMFF